MKIMSQGKVKGILIITPFFSPNIGGVETHFLDLIAYLEKKGHHVFVVTYQPLTTRAKGPSIEKQDHLVVRRIKWFGHNWFPTLEKIPIATFLYLTPGLLFYSLFFLWKNQNDVDVIHTQGFVACFIGKILARIFKKRSVASVHTVYDLAKRPTLGRVFTWILKSYDKILAVSQGSKDELLSFGLDETKTSIFTYWANQDVFRLLDKEECKRQVGWADKFVVLFIGRLIKIKGAPILVEAARKVDKHIFFAFITTGIYDDFLEMVGQVPENVIYVGEVDYSTLNVYYNAADILAVPSQYSEGFARVNLEAMLCGTPVIASSKGCLPEIIKPTVGELLDPPTSDNFAKRIEFYYDHPEVLRQLSESCSRYALERFSEKNAQVIEESYHT